ncbi:MAG TPA: hypothetical protein VH054_21955, partial [Polyangiaceae bacterium]|nr:hypothetical protein [Polyangiaceae bacterium]
MKHPAQEPDRVPLRSILVVTAVTVAFFTAAVLAAAHATQPRMIAVPPPTDTLERSLAVVVARGLDKNAASARDLDRYRWVDRDAGIAEIP